MSNLSSNGRSAFHVPEPVARPVPLFYHIESTKHVWDHIVQTLNRCKRGRKRSKHVVSEEEKAFTARLKRKIASQKERMRVKRLNMGFARLRNVLPFSRQETKRPLSKLKVLYRAIEYIKFLEAELSQETQVLMKKTSSSLNCCETGELTLTLFSMGLSQYLIHIVFAWDY